MKICIKCNSNKNLNEFTITKKGAKAKCKTCIADYERNRLYIYSKSGKTSIVRENKICPQCKESKLISSFYKNSYMPDGRVRICKTCDKKNSRSLSRVNTRRKYKSTHPDKIRQQHKNYRNKNKDNPAFILRRLISVYVANHLGSNKKGSIKTYLPYTIEELKSHIENQFEPWMNWNNHGKYLKEWDDNNQLTWRWQLDHIIPHSEFHYNSMMDKEFIECWALKNLRPLSAKQNSIDGATRARHNKKE